MYATADGRHLTVAALEPKFFGRLCELLGRPELAPRQYDDDQEALVRELADIFATRTLAAWLELAEGEDVCLGPVATLAEAATKIRAPIAPRLGEHTELWRREVR
jgi:crotonobetainyl-CoA:carnitine CoA-transferase CaiB-like acyl-CoA transferase